MEDIRRTVRHSDETSGSYDVTVEANAGSVQPAVTTAATE